MTKSYSRLIVSVLLKDGAALDAALPSPRCPGCPGCPRCREHPRISATCNCLRIFITGPWPRPHPGTCQRHTRIKGFTLPTRFNRMKRKSKAQLAERRASGSGSQPLGKLTKQSCCQVHRFSGKERLAFVFPKKGICRPCLLCTFRLHTCLHPTDLLSIRQRVNRRVCAVH